MAGSPFFPMWHALSAIVQSPNHDANSTSGLVPATWNMQPSNALDISWWTQPFPSSLTDPTLYDSSSNDSDIQRAMQSLLPALWQAFAVILLGYACVKLEVVKQNHKQVRKRRNPNSSLSL